MLRPEPNFSTGDTDHGIAPTPGAGIGNTAWKVDSAPQESVTYVYTLSWGSSAPRQENADALFPGRGTNFSTGDTITVP